MVLGLTAYWYISHFFYSESKNIEFFFTYPILCSRYSDSLLTGWSVDRIPVGRNMLHPSRPTLEPTLPSIKRISVLVLRGKEAGTWS